MRKYIFFLIIGILLISVVTADEQVSNDLCGPEDPDDCPDGYERVCWQEPNGALYYTCEYNNEPQCPSDSPYWCSETQLCYNEPYRCSCIGVTCNNKCENKLLSYNGICGEGGCNYQTVSVECCSDSDCPTGNSCTGNICSAELSGRNFGFEEWATLVTPSFWDTNGNVYFIEQQPELTEGLYSLGLTSPFANIQVSGCSVFTQALQEFDLTGIDKLKFDCEGGYSHPTNGWTKLDQLCQGYINSGSETKTRFYIDNNEFNLITGENSFDVSSYSGKHTLKFYRAFCAEGAWGINGNTIKIDNIKLMKRVISLNLTCEDNCVGRDFYSNGVREGDSCIYTIETDSDKCGIIAEDCSDEGAIQCLSDNLATCKNGNWILEEECKFGCESSQCKDKPKKPFPTDLIIFSIIGIILLISIILAVIYVRKK